MAERERLLVISPHLDDAVLSCGGMLAACPGSVVVTVFAGVPADARMSTAWDRASGFASAAQAIAARRGEDARALTSLGARPHWLDFCDAQYGAGPSLAAVSEAVDAAIGRHGAQAVAMPFGLFHSDHDLAHRAAIALMRRRRAIRWLAYEDSPYRRSRSLLQRRLASLLACGIEATPEPAWCIGEWRGAKQAALACYASQLQALATPGRPGHGDLADAEVYWRLDIDAASAAAGTR